MNEKKDNVKKEINQEIINLVVARLKTIPGNARLSVGNGKEALPPEELVKEVENQTEIGKKIIESQLFFLRSLQSLPVT